MPEVFTRTLASVIDDADSSSDNAWRFDSWVPDALIINLGTNDVSSGSYNESSFAAAYVALCLNVSAHYATAAGGAGVTLFLACGPMSDAYCGGVKLALAQITTLKATAVAAATAAAALDGLTTTRTVQPLPRAAYFLDQTNLAGVSLGCCGHPSVADDKTMAASSGAFIFDAMGWASSSTGTGAF